MAALPIPALHASHGGGWMRDGIGVTTRATGKGEAGLVTARPPDSDGFTGIFLVQGKGALE